MSAYIVLFLLMVLGCICVVPSFSLMRGGLAHVPIVRSVVHRYGSDLWMSVKVECNPAEPIEETIKKFKRACNQSGHLMELKAKEHWETAAEKLKRKMTRSKLLKRIERTQDRYERRAHGGREYNS
jgi:ribosomal protein S21